MRRSIFGLGLLQVAMTTTVFAGIAYALGLAGNTALIVGFALSLSRMGREGRLLPPGPPAT